ncbi:MAG TPA: DUF2147 domain-containing protein [Sphingomicrobium sp.]|nr:DUF2147 domain-containing protein [Sphingomicrobium sp.]
MFTTLALLAVATAQAGSPDSIEGRWINPARTVIIDIAPCAEALCGTVQWATSQAQQDARLGTPHLVGTQLLTDLVLKGGTWEGKLFVPDRKLHVEGKIQPAGAQQLKVSGCEIGICKSQVWSRAEGPLPAPQ